MPPAGSSITLLSPAELSFLHTSLTSTPPIRPDLRKSTQFRPLVAETGILPSTNGSARICFSDGTEAIVGIKAELEKTSQGPHSIQDGLSNNDDTDEDMDDTNGAPHSQKTTRTTTASSYLDLSISLPSHRDDDPLPTFLSSMLTETLLASPTLARKLYINARWHWRLGIDVLLLSPPLSYPLPLLSLTTHLALLNTSLPRLKSDPEDDPLFDDDWGAAVPLYGEAAVEEKTQAESNEAKPPITLLVMTAGPNIIFDPSREELAVADAVLAVTIATTNTPSAPLRILAVRMVDPPSRLTPPGVPDVSNPNTAVGGAAAAQQGQKGNEKEKEKSGLGLGAGAMEAEKAKVWTPPRGGIKRDLVARVVKMVVEKGGVGEEVLAGLAGVET